MVDKDFAMSSYLAFRYIENREVNFVDGLSYRHPHIFDGNRIPVDTAEEIGYAIQSQISELGNKRLGILLSGGMDSAILASYLSPCDAYTFRFLGGEYQKEELDRARRYAEIYGHKLHYVDIDWNVIKECLEVVMRYKGGPVHSIEPQIYRAAQVAKQDGIDVMIIGDGSDYVFGGMDKLLSQDWTYDEFYHRYMYIDPAEVLVHPKDMHYLFDRYKKKESFDYLSFLDVVATEESYGSYDNAFCAAKLEYFDPYAKLIMKQPLDLQRIRSGESKYLVRQLFKMRYPELEVPEKIPMPRPVDIYFADWEGPSRKEFRSNICISEYSGNQKWLLWCLEEFLNMVDEGII